MITFILKKLGKLAALLAAISILSFILISYSPVDPVRSYIGAEISRISPEQQKNIEQYWGLNQSKPQQFLQWAKALTQGNLGTSLIYREPVSEIIIDRFSASIALMGLAWLFSGVFGFLLGILAGMNEGSLLDRLIKSYCFILASTPSFWLGLLLLMFFASWLGWFPVGLASPAGSLTGEVSFADKINHLFLPVLTLSIVGVAGVALHTREKLIEVLNSEFIRFARAKGESGIKLFWRHGLRNISLPAISLHFASFGELFGGAVLTEQVFSYPGLGQAVVKAGLGGDVPLLLGITLFSVIFIFVGNFIADLLYVVIDPRMQIKPSHD
ncbi:ABC transporter permease [Gelidibacter salicanalis]|uniref:ABC transporter permease n=1 Tax=Gelidibacter salicanalis TaxID=291193 RepID=A0A934KR71_9FLAO|nr:ABC transporter permease [Gelidibacter salicanalis]MBJ7882024.1 ABC transporter permease [Gelidibacter salicanalis]